MHATIRILRRHHVALAFVLSALYCKHSYADLEDARILFREGKQLAASGLYEAAHAKFVKSFNLESGVGTQYQIGDCLERMGRTASARTAFLRAAEMALGLGQEKRAQVAAERADALLPRLSRMRIQCESACPEKLRVLRDEVALAESSWQEPNEIDPGKYRLEAELFNGTLWSVQVNIPTDPGLTVVAIPAVLLESHSDPPQKLPLARPAMRNSSPVQFATKAEKQTANPSLGPTSSGVSVFPKVMFWIGVGGLTLAGASALALHDKNAQASGICPSGQDCTTSEIGRHSDLVDQAKLYRAGVYAGVGLGVASIATAAIVQYVLNPRRKERNPTQTMAGVSPVGGEGGFGMTAYARGEF